MKMLKYLLLIGPIIVCAQSTPPAFVTDSLEIYVQRALKDWQLPGCAVAIIKEGQIVLTRGYGFRDLEQHLPVDEHS